MFKFNDVTENYKQEHPGLVAAQELSLREDSTDDGIVLLVKEYEGGYSGMFVPVDSGSPTFLMDDDKVAIYDTPLDAWQGLLDASASQLVGSFEEVARATLISQDSGPEDEDGGDDDGGDEVTAEVTQLSSELEKDLDAIEAQPTGEVQGEVTATSDTATAEVTEGHGAHEGFEPVQIDAMLQQGDDAQQQSSEPVKEGESATHVI